MPNRVLREGILSSDRVNLLDAPAEVFYRRLMSVVDDFGRFDARPVMLKVSCFPLRADTVREADISRWIAICEKAGLIALYVANGRPYVEMLDFRQSVRAKTSKYPGRPPGTPSASHVLSMCDADATQMQRTRDAHAPVVEVEVEGEDERARHRIAKARPVPLPAGFAISDRVRTWAADKGHQHLDARLEHFVGYAKRSGKRYVDWDEAFMSSIREDWAKLNGQPSLLSTAEPSKRVAL